MKNWTELERRIRLCLTNTQKDLEIGTCDQQSLATALMTISEDLGELTGRGFPLSDDFVDRASALVFDE